MRFLTGVLLVSLMVVANFSGRNLTSYRGKATFVDSAARSGRCAHVVSTHRFASEARRFYHGHDRVSKRVRPLLLRMRRCSPRATRRFETRVWVRLVRAHNERRRRWLTLYEDWSKVAVCESGGWRVLGSSYPNSLGITRTNYLMFGGSPQPVGPVSMAGRAAQIRVAQRLVKHYGIGIPDQGGCQGAW